MLLILRHSFLSVLCQNIVSGTVLCVSKGDNDQTEEEHDSYMCRPDRTPTISASACGNYQGVEVQNNTGEV